MDRGTKRGTTSSRNAKAKTPTVGGVSTIPRGRSYPAQSSGYMSQPNMGSGSSKPANQRYQGKIDPNNKYSRYQQRYHQIDKGGEQDLGVLRDPVSSWIPFLLLAGIGIVVCIIWYLSFKGTAASSVMTLPQMFSSSIGLLIGAVVVTIIFTAVTGHISYSNNSSASRGDILTTALLKSTVALALFLVAWVIVMIAAS